MLETLYTSTTGLQTFAKGLEVISANVTNVNTVGYKATTLAYRDIHYQFSLHDERRQTWYGAQYGGGVAADITSLLFTQGELRQTANDTDAAIVGRGLFVLEDAGGYVYTRNGQFEFDEAGDLVTRDGGRRVLGLSESGALTPVNRNALLMQPAVPTTRINFGGNLSTGSTSAITNNIPVIDSLGGSHTLRMTLTPDTGNPLPRTWRIALTDENNQAVGDGSGRISFQSNGAPAQGANSFTFTYQAPGADPQQITFLFGEPGSFAGVTSFSTGTTSTVVAGASDGRAQGSLLSLSFDAQGRLAASYSNQGSATGMALALADFDNLQALQQLGQGLYRAQPEQRARVGAPGSQALGSIAARNVESSNVDLSGQFADMIVIQRGYQASSQVLTVANELMQQLLESSKR